MGLDSQQHSAAPGDSKQQDRETLDSSYMIKSKNIGDRKKSENVQRGKRNNLQKDKIRLAPDFRWYQM